MAKPRAEMKVAPDETEIYIEGIGVTTVGEYAKVVEARVPPRKAPKRRIEKIKALLNSFTETPEMSAKKLREANKKVKEQFNTKAGVSVWSLLGEGLIARMKVKGKAPFYVLTKKGHDLVGAPEGVPAVEEVATEEAEEVAEAGVEALTEEEEAEA